jgi:hypothetical protein
MRQTCALSSWLPAKTVKAAFSCQPSAFSLAAAALDLSTMS